jgi:hypothetical protein
MSTGLMSPTLWSGRRSADLGSCSFVTESAQGSGLLRFRLWPCGQHASIPAGGGLDWNSNRTFRA